MAAASGASGGRAEADELNRTAGPVARWRRERASSSRAGSRRLTILTACAYFALTGVLVWVALWLWPPRASCVILVGAGYETNLAVPHNAEGRRSLAGLAAIARRAPTAMLWRSRGLRLARDPIPLTTRSTWERDLSTATEPTVVLVFAAHGGSDDEGPYLLPDDAANTSSPRNRLRVEAILEGLRTLVPARKNKLLVFDATRLDALPGFGMIRDDFARGLAGLESKIASIPNLVVVSASDIDRRSWTSDAFRDGSTGVGGSAFLHFWGEGLAGAAADVDGRVNAELLFDYAANRVDAWALPHRGEAQKPILLPSGSLGRARARRIELAAANRIAAVATVDRGEAPGVRGPWLDAWRRFARNNETRPHPAAHAPRLWALYLAVLERYDALMRVGDARSARLMLDQLFEIERELPRAQLVELTSSPVSLSMPVLEGLGALAAMDVPAAEFEALWIAGDDAASGLWQRIRTGPKADSSTSRDPRLVRAQFAAFLHRRVLQNPSANLKRAARLARLVEPPGMPRTAELNDIVLFDRDLPVPGGPELDHALSRALSLRVLAETAACAAGEPDAGHPEVVAAWIEPRVRAAGRDRRLAHDLIFTADANRLAEAETLFNSAEREFKAALDDAAVFDQALRLRDLWRPLVPYYAAWAARRRDPAAAASGSNVDTINPESRAVVELADALDAIDDATHLYEVETGSTPPTSLDPATAPPRVAVARALAAAKALEIAFARACETALADESPRAWETIDDLLRVPFLDLKDPPPELTRLGQLDRPLRVELVDRQSRLDRRGSANPAAKTTSSNGNPLTGSAAGEALGQVVDRLKSVAEVGGTANPTPANFAPASPTQSEDASSGSAGAIARTYRIGRLELAQLGTRWYDESPRGVAINPEAAPAIAGPGGANAIDNAAHLLRMLAMLIEPKRLPSERDLLVREAGDSIGRRRRFLPDEVVRRLEGRGTIAKEPPTRSDLLAAARLTRRLDGEGARRLSREIEARSNLRDPTITLRSVRLADLLVSLARRTLNDHWASEDTNAPYYRTAGLAMLDDARRLMPPGFDLKPMLTLESELRRLDRLHFEDAAGLVEASATPRVDATRASLVLTGERPVDLEFRLRNEPGLPLIAGAPVVSIDAGPGLRVVSPTAAQRFPRVVGPNLDPPIHLRLDSPLLIAAELTPPPVPTVARSNLTLRGLFRGQKFERVVDADLHEVPEVVASSRPRPPTGGVVVRADRTIFERFGAGNGAVAVVLDASGTMGPPEGQEFGPTDKYAQAVRALREVLREVPAGAIVSVWTFGAAVPPKMTVDEAEKTIARVVDPLRWDPRDPAIEHRVFDKLEYPNVKPWNKSPVVRALLEARKDLDDASIQGLKTLVVLTDGHDNRWEQDREANPNGKTVAETLTAAFSGSDIVVRVVGFLPNKADADKIREQFAVIEKFPMPGKFYAIDDARGVVDGIRRVIRRRLMFRVDREQAAPAAGAIPVGERAVSLLGVDYQWLLGLPPDGYRIRVDADQPLSANIELDAGDLLTANIESRDDGLAIVRGVWSRDDYPFKPALEVSGRRAAILQNRAPGGSGLELLATLEKTSRDETSESVLKIDRPREFWLEVRPRATGTKAASTALRWGNREGYPAPAWLATTSRWPRAGSSTLAAQPVVGVWWHPTRETPAALVLDPGLVRDLVAGRTSHSFELPSGGKVRIESITVEPHPVEIAAGVRQVRSCLVIRVAHAPGQTAWARPRGVLPAGRELRLYETAGESAALYWPVEPAAIADLRAVEIVTLADLKRHCEADQHVILMSELPPPRPDDPTPPEPASPAGSPAINLPPRPEVPPPPTPPAARTRAVSEASPLIDLPPALPTLTRPQP